MRDGAAHVAGDPATAKVQLVAIGAYQLEEALKARAHLAGRGHRVKGSTTTPEKVDVLAQAGIAPYLIRLDEPDGNPGDFFDADVLFLNVPPGRRLADVEERYGALMRRVAALLRGAPDGRQARWPAARPRG